MNSFTRSGLGAGRAPSWMEKMAARPIASAPARGSSAVACLDGPTKRAGKLWRASQPASGPASGSLTWIGQAPSAFSLGGGLPGRAAAKGRSA